jgi:hypothetical protein
MNSDSKIMQMVFISYVCIMDFKKPSSFYTYTSEISVCKYCQNSEILDSKNPNILRGND